MVKFTKKEIGKKLTIELDKGYSTEKISHWALDLYVLSTDSLEIDNILSHISSIDSGPEFIYSQKELEMLAQMLIDNEEDPIGKLQKIKDSEKQ